MIFCKSKKPVQLISLPNFLQDYELETHGKMKANKGISVHIPVLIQTRPNDLAFYVREYKIRLVFNLLFVSRVCKVKQTTRN